MESMKALVLAKIGDEEFGTWFNEYTGRLKFVVYQGLPAMNKDLDCLELSPRPYHCLKRAGYTTINSLVDNIEHMSDLARIRNMGKKSIYEVMAKLFLYTYDNLKPEKRKAYLEKVRNLNQ